MALPMPLCFNRLLCKRNPIIILSSNRKQDYLDYAVEPSDEQPSERFSPRTNNILLGLGTIMTVVLVILLIYLGVQMFRQAANDIVSLLVLGPIYLIAIGFAGLYATVVVFAWRGWQWASYALLLLTTLLLPLIMLVVVIGWLVVG
jgi:hypothetical protein